MSEFTFSCPVCGQPIRYDTASASSNIVCPSCRRTVATPRTGGTPAPFSPATRPTPTGTSGLAIASFICSVFLCVGCIPGIICGHLAQRKIRREPGLGGNGFAIAGLVISYLSLVGTVGCGLLVLACMSSPTFMKGFREGFNEAQQRRASHFSYSTRESAGSANTSVEPDPLWTLNLSAAEFPDQPAAGKIYGQEMPVTNVTAQNGVVTFELSANRRTAQVLIFTFRPNGESLAGKTWNFSVGAASKPGVTRPHIHVRSNNGTSSKSNAMTSGYALKLEFGDAQPDGSIPGKIYLCLPDNQKSYVAGSFTLEPKKP